MPMYNLTEYSDVYSKTSGGLQQCYRDELALDNNNNIINLLAINNNSISFKFKQQITQKAGNGGTKDVEIMVPLKSLSNFSRTLEMPLVNCEVNLQLKWSKKNFSAGTEIDHPILCDQPILDKNKASLLLYSFDQLHKYFTVLYDYLVSSFIQCHLLFVVFSNRIYAPVSFT